MTWISFIKIRWKIQCNISIWISFAIFVSNKSNGNRRSFWVEWEIEWMKRNSEQCILYTARKMTKQKINNRIRGKIIVMKVTVSFDGIVCELERISVWMDGRKKERIIALWNEWHRPIASRYYRMDMSLHANRTILWYRSPTDLQQQSMKLFSNILDTERWAQIFHLILCLCWIFCCLLNLRTVAMMEFKIRPNTKVYANEMNFYRFDNNNFSYGKNENVKSREIYLTYYERPSDFHESRMTTLIL